MAATSDDTVPDLVELMFSAEDGIGCVHLIEILEKVKSAWQDGYLPPRITDISMNDHHLKIVLRP